MSHSNPSLAEPGEVGAGIRAYTLWSYLRDRAEAGGGRRVGGVEKAAREPPGRHRRRFAQAW